MAAMEEKRRDGGARSLRSEFREQEVSAGLAPDVSAAAEGAHFSEGAPGFAAGNPLEGHLDDDHENEDSHNLTHMSQGGDTHCDRDQSEESLSSCS